MRGCNIKPLPIVKIASVAPICYTHLVKNLKAQTTILAIVFIALVSLAVGYLYLQNRDLKSQLGSGNEADNTPVPTKPEVNPSTPTQPTATPTGDEPVGKDPSYVCPKERYVNCMPIVAPGEPSKKCEKSYLDWAVRSCPAFKGPVY